MRGGREMGDCSADFQTEGEEGRGEGDVWRTAGGRLEDRWRAFGGPLEGVWEGCEMWWEYDGLMD